MSAWEEVRRLANDFQKVQQGSTAQRLSERNCIEIVNSLLKMRLLEVIYTTDGKEYLTPQQLSREIRDEIILSGGRINIVDVAQSLNVDLSHVENAAKDLVKSDPELEITLGQLINRDYLNSLADDMNERLQEHGVLNIADLAVVFDLPTDFLLEVVNNNLAKRIHGQRDPNNSRVLLTDWLIARHRAVLRGALNASCRPIAIQNLVKEFALNEKIAAMVVEELVQLGEVSGSLSGRKEKAIFIPNVYAAAQKDYVESFFKSNSYVPFDALKKLDIPEPKKYLQSIYTSNDIVFLGSSMVSKPLIDRVEAGLDDVHSLNSWTEISGLLPGGIDNDDVAEVVEKLLKSSKLTSLKIIADQFVVSDSLISGSRKLFESVIESGAEEEASKRAAVILATAAKPKDRTTAESKRTQVEEDDDSIPASKSTKKSDKQKKSTAKSQASKAGRQRKDSDGTEASPSVDVPSFLKLPAVVVELQKVHKEAPYELLEAIAGIIHPDLIQRYKSLLDEKARTIIESSSGDRKNAHKTVQEQVSATVWMMRLFAKGIQQFQAEADQKVLSKHLLRNISSEILNPLLFYVLDDLGVQYERKDLPAEGRTKLIAKLPEPLKTLFEKANTSGNGDNVQSFEDNLLSLLESEQIGISVKKADKKREQQIMQEHKSQILKVLPSSTDLPTALRLACLVLFQNNFGFPLDVPGKFVPQVISLLKSKLPAEQLDFLESCREKIQSQNFDSEELRSIVEKLHNAVKE